MNAPVSTEIADSVRSEALDSFNTDPAARLEYASAITLRHCPSDLSTNVRQQFDEPFEQQHVCWELNTIQGPWAEHDSGGVFRWLQVRNSDLDDVQTGHDFLSLVYRHLVPA